MHTLDPRYRSIRLFLPQKQEETNFIKGKCVWCDARRTCLRSTESIPKQTLPPPRADAHTSLPIVEMPKFPYRHARLAFGLFTEPTRKQIRSEITLKHNNMRIKSTSCMHRDLVASVVHGEHSAHLLNQPSPPFPCPFPFLCPPGGRRSSQAFPGPGRRPFLRPSLFPLCQHCRDRRCCHQGWRS